MISDAFQLKPASVALPDGEQVRLRRPTALDMIDAIQEARERPETFAAWLVLRHTLAEDGPMFGSIEDVLAADGHAVAAVSNAIQGLYEQGRD